MTQIIDGKTIASRIYKDIAELTAKLKPKPKISLAAIFDSNCAEGKSYVNVISRNAESLGIFLQKFEFAKPEFESTLAIIQHLNASKHCSAILLVKPFLDDEKFTMLANSIEPKKDVDCLSAYNLGLFVQGRAKYKPAVVEAVFEVMKEIDFNLQGKDVCIVGSGRVGSLLVQALSQFATLTMCNKYTKNLEKKTSKADLLISCAGVPGLITEDNIKEGATIIDIGTTLVEGKLFGDVDLESVKSKASFVTPVPNGIGPITAACLLRNVVRAYVDKG